MRTREFISKWWRWVIGVAVLLLVVWWLVAHFYFRTDKATVDANLRAAQQQQSSPTTTIPSTPEVEALRMRLEQTSTALSAQTKQNEEFKLKFVELEKVVANLKKASTRSTNRSSTSSSSTFVRRTGSNRNIVKCNCWRDNLANK